MSQLKGYQGLFTVAILYLSVIGNFGRNVTAVNITQSHTRSGQNSASMNVNSPKSPSEKRLLPVISLRTRAKVRSSNVSEMMCICYSHLPSSCPSSVCKANYGCYSSIQLEGERKIIQKGCFVAESQFQMYCNFRGDAVASFHCCYEPYCNQDVNPTLSVTEADIAPANSNFPIIISVAVVLAVISLAIGMFSYLRKNHKKRMAKMDPERPVAYQGGLRVEAVGENTLRDMMATSCSSGSGSGLPVLVPRTVARQISLVNCIGKGRYGEVWRGEWQGDSVAVKIFSSRDEQSFHRETEIYNTVMLRHLNILTYIASDMISKNSCTELWLICVYHPLGSLYEFLQRSQLTKKLMIQLCFSAANGLSHLHTEISGVEGKPAIAHRDVKSKNILVKSNFTCCIADLGLAVMHKHNSIDINKSNSRVGTKRYMAPEILDETLNPLVFDSFKQADVYAFALVLWETARRCVIGGKAEEYKPPFYDVVGHDPSFEDMRKIVCDDDYRPTLLNHWQSDPTMMIMANLMKEMWSKSASSRLTLLRVKKSLNKAQDLIGGDLLDHGEKDTLIPIRSKDQDSGYSTNLLQSEPDDRV